MQVKLMRCRSHETHTTPRPWEFVFEGTLRQAYLKYLRMSHDSGDEYKFHIGDETMHFEEFIFTHYHDIQLIGE